MDEDVSRYFKISLTMGHKQLICFCLEISALLFLESVLQNCS